MNDETLAEWLSLAVQAQRSETSILVDPADFIAMVNEIMRLRRDKRERMALIA